MPIGQCGLCQQVGELQDSHCLPASLYNLSREPGRQNPNPVVIRPVTTITSSRQVSSYFLCKSCETRFSSNGETIVLAECSREPTQFKLRERLRTFTPLIESKDNAWSVYDAQSVLGGSLERYLYFAASVFWRASAHKWTWNGETIRGITLGEKYQEQFRRYLLGDANFPANARIFLHVSSELEVETTTIFPCTYRVERVHRHKFYIPGFLFILFLGSDASQRFDSSALNGSGQKCIWLCPFGSDSLFAGMAKLIKGSRPVGSLLSNMRAQAGVRRG